MITSPKSGRCIGSGCQHDVTSSAKACGQCGGTFGRSAWSPATAAAICSEDMYVRSYARLRVNISHATIPNEYTSTFWLYCSPRCTSGAMYRALPVCPVRSSSSGFAGGGAKPKSATVPLRCSRELDGPLAKIADARRATARTPSLNDGEWNFESGEWIAGDEVPDDEPDGPTSDCERGSAPGERLREKEGHFVVGESSRGDLERPVPLPPSAPLVSPAGAASLSSSSSDSKAAWSAWISSTEGRRGRAIRACPGPTRACRGRSGGARGVSREGGGWGGWARRRGGSGEEVYVLPGLAELW